MGYRSEVAIELDPTEAQILKTLAKKCEKLKEVVNDSETPDSLWDANPDEEVVIHWSYAKWYTDYECVSAIMGFLDNLEEESYKFIRIGEEFDDVEILGSKWGNLDVQRSLTW